MTEHRLEVADVFRTYESDFFAKWGHVTRSSSKKSLRGYSRLPHGRPRRPCGRVRRVRAPRHLVQFLPQQALSKMPGHGARQMAGRKGGRVVAGPVFPRCIYGASKHRWPGTPECAPDLSHSISRGIGNAAHDCRGSQTSGRLDRLFGCASHLGTKPSSPSTSSLRHTGRRYLTGRRQLGRLPEIVLSSCPRVEPAVPKQVSDLSQKGVSGRQAALPRRDGRFGQAGSIRGPVPRSGTDRVGCLCEAAMRRPRASSEVSGALHASGCHRQSTAVVDGRRAGDFGVERLCRRQPDQNDDAGCGRVHPAFSSPHCAGRFRAHPAVWFLANRARRKKLALCRALLAAPPASPKVAKDTAVIGQDGATAEKGRKRCPVCQIGHMIPIMIVQPAPLAALIPPQDSS